MVCDTNDALIVGSKSNQAAIGDGTEIRPVMPMVKAELTEADENGSLRGGLAEALVESENFNDNALQLVQETEKRKVIVLGKMSAFAQVYLSAMPNFEELINKVCGLVSTSIKKTMKRIGSAFKEPEGLTPESVMTTVGKNVSTLEDICNYVQTDHKQIIFVSCLGVACETQGMAPHLYQHRSFSILLP